MIEAETAGRCEMVPPADLARRRTERTGSWRESRSGRTETLRGAVRRADRRLKGLRSDGDVQACPSRR